MNGLKNKKRSFTSSHSLGQQFGQMSAGIAQLGSTWCWLGSLVWFLCSTCWAGHWLCLDHLIPTGTVGGPFRGAPQLSPEPASYLGFLDGGLVPRWQQQKLQGSGSPAPEITRHFRPILWVKLSHKARLDSRCGGERFHLCYKEQRSHIAKGVQGIAEAKFANNLPCLLYCVIIHSFLG